MKLHAIAIWTAALGVAGAASAIDVEKLVMPGPVIEGHASVEAECSRCHAAFRAEAQNGLCLDCHEAVAGDLQQGEGFHGRQPAVGSSECKACHSDHVGRDADVVGLDPASFDHDLSDYPLRGGHRRAPCAQCHQAGQKFREAPATCFACHARDDVHAGRLGDRCGDCHSERAWVDTAFDHATTRFPLSGRHRDVECGLCHPGGRFEGTAMDCHSCHAVGDVHLGRFGADCARCHTAADWTMRGFDHARDTKFRLSGRHRDAACTACHTGASLDQVPGIDCIACHAADDEHRGRNGTKCDRCHGEDTWRTTIFDHDRSTDFPLRGAHREVKCLACHEGALYEEHPVRSCDSCHGSDDVHRGQEGPECGRCHAEDGWIIEVFFDHDLTRFPLLGLHAVSTCEQCHLTPRFKDAELDCMGCHQEDDVHRRGLGTACEQCHNPNAWKLWRFDHALQTDFPLRGAHERLDCRSCHRSSVAGAIVLATNCGGCHARDDVHYGAFGRDCERCHGDLAWDDVEVIR